MVIYPFVSTKKREERTMRDFKSLAHTRWDCKYHVVFIPKRRRKLIYGKLRSGLGDIFQGKHASQIDRVGNGNQTHAAASFRIESSTRRVCARGGWGPRRMARVKPPCSVQVLLESLGVWRRSASCTGRESDHRHAFLWHGR